MLRKFTLLLGFLSASTLLCQARDLEIYWIDAEGGAATLIVSPSGESLLVDTANRRVIWHSELPGKSIPTTR